VNIFLSPSRHYRLVCGQQSQADHPSMVEHDSLPPVCQCALTLHMCVSIPYVRERETLIDRRIVCCCHAVMTLDTILVIAFPLILAKKLTLCILQTFDERSSVSGSSLFVTTGYHISISDYWQLRKARCSSYTFNNVKLNEFHIDISTSIYR